MSEIEGNKFDPRSVFEKIPTDKQVKVSVDSKNDQITNAVISFADMNEARRFIIEFWEAVAPEHVQNIEESDLGEITDGGGDRTKLLQTPLIVILGGDVNLKNKLDPNKILSRVPGVRIYSNASSGSSVQYSISDKAQEFLKSKGYIS